MDLLFRVACHGGSDEPLNIHLKRITDSAYTRKSLGGAEIDGEFIAPVIQESHDGDCRREIMKHLRGCLSEASGKRWQRIYGGLALTEKLMLHGSHELAIEVAHGHHFDLVQKVSLLERFDAVARGCSDRRAQHVIRSKASELNAALIPLLEKASLEDLPQNAGLNGGKDVLSISSKDTASVSTSTGSTAASSTMTSTVSPTSSMLEEPETTEPPSQKQQIDQAFSSLEEWMESAGYTSGSAAASPRGSASDDSDWEPIGQLPSPGKPSERSPSGDKSENGDNNDTFFTPMPAPAEPAKSKSRFGRWMMSL